MAGPGTAGGRSARARSYDLGDGARFPVGEDASFRQITYARAHPVLESATWLPSWRNRLRGGSVFAVYHTVPVLILGGGGLVATGFEPGSTGIRVLVGAAAVVALWGFLCGLVVGVTPVGAYAGAHAVSDGEGRSTGLYDLSAVAVVDRRDGRHVVLTGREDVLIEFPLRLLEGNPQLWNLVYHGIRHSVAAGASIGDQDVQRLRLTEDPEPAPTRPREPTTTGLPPIPDARGNPRPARAPQVAEPWRGGGAPRARSDLSVPEALLTLRARRRHGRARAAVGLAGGGCLPTLLLIALAGGAVLLFTGGSNVSGAAHFLVGSSAVGFAFMVVVFWFDRRSMSLHIGARWLVDDVSGRVDLYRLTSIRVHTTLRAGRVLRLTDREGHRIAGPLGLLAAYPEAWDLVHIGLCHSAASAAARVDDATRALLRLPAAPPLRRHTAE